MPRHRKSSRKKSVAPLVGYALIILGFFFLGFPLVAPRLKSSSVDSPILADPAFGQTDSQSLPPVKIIIPSLGIDVRITPAKLKKGVWETHETTASFGEGSSPPGRGGNTVIFAHAREGLFLPLTDARIGDIIFVLNGKEWFSYHVTEIKKVRPTDTFVVKPSKDTRLTLFTCSGFFDQQRLVIVALP